MHVVRAYESNALSGGCPGASTERGGHLGMGPRSAAPAAEGPAAAADASFGQAARPRGARFARRCLGRRPAATRRRAGRTAVLLGEPQAAQRRAAAGRPGGVAQRRVRTQSRWKGWKGSEPFAARRGRTLEGGQPRNWMKGKKNQEVAPVKSAATHATEPGEDSEQKEAQGLRRLHLCLHRDTCSSHGKQPW